MNRAIDFEPLMRNNYSSTNFPLKAKVFYRLYSIHFYRLCNIMWDVTNNIAPSNISYSFLKTTDVHHYATRSSTKDDFYVEHSKLEKVRNSFLRTGPKVWNALPSDFRNLSKFTFQKKLKHRLVELLAKADDYLEITQIIHAIKLT